ncbi:MAG: succinate--CoA ligase subunit alpha, partial [Acidobacteriota bacterium]|nr:succinate--CoA ligase subunit alpha [Acidobacteriota bacterium]
EMFEKDDETALIVMIGEIGGSQEEQVADLIESGKVTKPIVAYIGGKAAQSGTRYSHAGAIVEGGRGTWQGKVDRLREVGANVVEQFSDIPQKVKEIIACETYERNEI